MHILISNDDGYKAQGIRTLAQTMRYFGRVTVIAPATNQSGASNSLTLNKALDIETIDENLTVVTGTPSDCVHLAMTGLLEQRPDLVLSGINCGANMGDDTMYSGTVAAAVEGFIFGVDSIAFSQVERGWKYLDDAAYFSKVIVERFLANKTTDEAMLLNVNIPVLPKEKIRGVMATRLGRRHNAQNMIEQDSPRGGRMYWLGAAGSPRDAGEGTDFWAIAQNYISVTPLQIDLTAHRQVQNTRHWVADF